MELNYKIYRKVKIYFNKICGAIPNLTLLKERSELTFGGSLVASRIEEMQLVQAQLVNFFMNPDLIVPFVPSSRCTALSTWYGNNALQSCGDLGTFQVMLTKEDDKVLEEANYMIVDPLLPSKLQVLFKKHRKRLKNIRINKESLNELER
ncbi:hypothetical protein [uncultured Zobellia sp.]|uniref:hypothetical protein n=1 Tax=uncultured Zobellia sp. TaxID=255433 RepID=UPI002598546E|nr:hypothetical protein [uncultured Zobellia sp.]